MPWETLSWARKARTGSPGRKAVLMVLAEHADERDSCFPSQALLAEATEQSTRTVRAHLVALEEAGLIRREHRGKDGGGRSSDRYFLLTKAEDLAGFQEGKAETLATFSGSVSPEQSGSLSPLEQPVELTTPEPPVPPPSPPAVVSDPFETAFSCYPRKDAKADARKAWPAAVKKAGGVEPILAGIVRYAADPNREDQFTPYMAKWLRGERWNDPPLPSKIKRGAPAAQLPTEDPRRSGPGGRIVI